MCSLSTDGAPSGQSALAFASILECGCIGWVGTACCRTRWHERRMGTMNIMNTRTLLPPALILALAGCSGDDAKLQPVVPTQISSVDGNGQSGAIGSTLPTPLRVRVTDASNNPVPGIVVGWSVVDGGGAVTPTS